MRTHALAFPFALVLLLSAARSFAEAPPISSTSHVAAVPLRLPVTHDVAKNMVAAALRASGLGTNDDEVESMLARSHSSALLPELHLRAARRVDDEIYSNEPTGPSSYAFPDRVETLFEARLTWHLERLVYSNEEPALERLRIERLETRARITAHVLSVLAEWQRAWVDLHTLPADAPASLDATMRSNDAEATLDVITAGWFSRWRARAPP